MTFYPTDVIMTLNVFKANTESYDETRMSDFSLEGSIALSKSINTVEFLVPIEGHTTMLVQVPVELSTVLEDNYILQFEVNLPAAINSFGESVIWNYTGTFAPGTTLFDDGTVHLTHTLDTENLQAGTAPTDAILSINDLAGGYQHGLNIVLSESFVLSSSA